MVFREFLANRNFTRNAFATFNTEISTGDNSLSCTGLLIAMSLSACFSSSTLYGAVSFHTGTTERCRIFRICHSIPASNNIIDDIDENDFRNLFSTADDRP